MTDELALANGRRWELSSTGLKFLEPLTYEEFENICYVLGQWNQAVRFAIGDAIMAGEEMFGQDAYQAFESLNLSEDAMREYVRVSQRVPRSRRRASLSWSHHRAVAALPPPEQTQWLRQASSSGMSHHALREALRESGGGGSPSNPPASARQTCSCCGRSL